MKKIEQALPVAIAARKELTTVTRDFTRATKNIVALEAKLLAAQAELDTIIVKAQAALKAANTSGKVLSAKPKTVPTTKPAAKKPAVVAKPLPKPTAKVAPVKLTRAEMRDAAKATKAKAPAVGKAVAAKPAAKKVAAKPAAKKVAATPATKKPAAKAAK